MLIRNIYEQAHKNPHKTALIYNCTEISYSAFVRAIDATRLYLASYELRTGSVGVTCCNNLLDSWLAGLALCILGLTTLAAPTLDLVPKLGLRNIGAVVGGADTKEPNLPANGSWQSIRLPTNMSTSVMEGDVPAMPEMAMPLGGRILLTSATTGAPKKVMTDLETEAMEYPLVTEINGISDQSVVYVPDFGLWTVGGHNLTAQTWSVGGTVVIHEAPDKHRPFLLYDMTHAIATPDHLSRLLSAPEGELRHNDALRLIVPAGALSQSLAAAAKARLTRQVFTSYSATLLSG